MTRSSNAWFVTAVCLLLIAPFALVAVYSQPTTMPASENSGTTSGGPNQPDIEELMEVMEKAKKALKPQIADAAKNLSSADLVARMQKSALAAKDLTPLMAEKFQGAERDKFIRAYRIKMIELIQTLLKLEQAFLDNKNEDAATLFKSLRDLEKSGHKEFTEEHHD